MIRRLCGRRAPHRPATPRYWAPWVADAGGPVAGVRYLDVVPLPTGGHRLYDEAPLPDGSHELRTTLVAF